MENIDIINALLNGVKEFLGYIDWIYVLLVIFTSWIVITFFKLDKNADKTLKNKLDIRKRYFVLGVGVVIAIFYFWLMDYNNPEKYIFKDQIRNLFISFVFSIVLNLYVGVSELLDKIFKKKP